MSKIKKSILNILKLLILVNINGNMYIYNKDTDNLIKYVPIINEQGKLIKFVIKRYDINGNFVDDFYESEVFNL